MNKIPVYIVTGFLGSGKTTFLNRLIDECAGSIKLAIVQNEFAPANIDGRELKRRTAKEFSLLEINNGSVFCVCLLSGFVESLKNFALQHKPELIVIETSGLSDPVSVGEIFNSPSLQELLYLAGIVCITDSSNFLKMEKMHRQILRQVQTADCILINKIDLVPDPDSIERRIHEINPQARKFKTRYANVPTSEIFVKHDSSMPDLLALGLTPGLGRPQGINSVVFKTTRTLKAEFAKIFASEIAEPSLRVKGYLALDNGKCLAIQGVSGSLHIEEISNLIPQTELIVMGYELAPRNIREMYKRYANEYSQMSGI